MIRPFLEPEEANSSSTGWSNANFHQTTMGASSSSTSWNNVPFLEPDDVSSYRAGWSHAPFVASTEVAASSTTPKNASLSVQDAMLEHTYHKVEGATRMVGQLLLGFLKQN